MKLGRWIKHRWLDEGDSRRLLDDAALARLQARVRASELRHHGEIRICVEAGLPLSYLWQKRSARERALTLFGKLRVWDTEANNGVLIYLLLADHAIEIVADRGLSRHVPQSQWAEVVADLSDAIHAGRCETGLAQAVDRVDALLVEHFALAPGQINPNELPDHVHRI
ncbi:MAG: TPM domain-containing protein [Rubrivivax sp.]|nr:TPM domain-containing protein [Rubrivivax sp.]